jgi:hypothetical protein
VEAEPASGEPPAAAQSVDAPARPAKKAKVRSLLLSMEGCH